MHPPHIYIYICPTRFFFFFSFQREKRLQEMVFSALDLRRRESGRPKQMGGFNFLM